MASGRGPGERDIDRVRRRQAIRSRRPGLEICVCLGLLDERQAARLKEAGADAYNHNLNTAANVLWTNLHHAHFRRQGETVRRSVCSRVFRRALA